MCRLRASIAQNAKFRRSLIGIYLLIQ